MCVGELEFSDIVAADLLQEKVVNQRNYRRNAERGYADGGVN
jgi:hypothetical protein